MPPEWIVQVGAGGAFVLIALWLVLNFLKSRKSPEPTGGLDLPEINRRLIKIEDRMGSSEQQLAKIIGMLEAKKGRR